jgi:DNA-binding transcriptional regulator of glucitol operon
VQRYTSVIRREGAPANSVGDGGAERGPAGAGTLTHVRRFLTPGWLGLHLIAIVLIGIFMLAGWWQLARAQGGNLQSWAYVIEWPMFAIFVVAMWVRMVRDELRGETRQDPGTMVPDRAAPAGEIDDEDDEELAAYNRRLARLNDEAPRR